MQKSSKVASSIRLAVACATSATVIGWGATATAQEQSTEQVTPERVERIQVTGSRLQRTDLENSSPVTVIGRDDIDAGGYSNLGELLTTLNQADALGSTNNTNNTNGNDGTQTISLRGIGACRTLLLVDVRRWLALGGGQVDISQIPMQTVERIEVLSDGASAIYGSDAIAGVINIITRSNFEGMEVDARYSQTGENDGENKEVGISLGTRNDKSSIFININKVSQMTIGAGDRAISSVPVAGTSLALSATGEFGYFRIPGTENWVSLLPEKEIEGLKPGDRTVDDFGPPVRYNYAPDNYLLTPYERLSMFLKADHQFNDSVRGFTQFTFNQRKSETAIAAVPLTNFSSGPQWEIPISKDNIFNPFGEDVEGSSFRMSPAGSRIRNQDYDT